MARIASIDYVPPVSAESGRNLLARTTDSVLAAIRTYAAPLHWLGAGITALAMFAYAKVAAWTSRLAVDGVKNWPELPAPCVLAIWHGQAPSLLVAFARRRPPQRIVIMIAGDPRGDFLACLCRLLGLRVVRGESGERGWQALAELASELDRGAVALITADGFGPSRIAKVGAAALSTAARVPAAAVGANCRPAILERHKWDAARIPLPFCRLAVVLADPLEAPVECDFNAVETHRLRLQKLLEETSDRADELSRGSE